MKIKLAFAVVIGLIICLVVMAVHERSSPEGVNEFGRFSLGGRSPIGPGSATFAPELKIPRSKFYVGIAQEDLWCVFEECYPKQKEGERIKALGGWLQVDNTEDYGFDAFDLWDRKDVRSIIFVADKDGLLVGIYPNGDIHDLNFVMEEHRDIIGF